MDFLLWDDMSACNSEEVHTLLQWAQTFCPQRAQKALLYRDTFHQWACLKTFYLLTQRLTEMRLIQHSQALKITFNPHGKPALEQQNKRLPIYFSISHCKSALLIAIHDKPIGADVEHPRTLSQRLIERTMNPNEQQCIAQNRQYALELWTKKEALLKMRGTGINSIAQLPQLLQNATTDLQITTTQTPQYTFSIAFVP